MGRVTSEVWHHFVKGNKRGECRYCQASLSIPSGSTTNLKRHMKTKHPLIPLQREEKPRSRSPSVDAVPVQVQKVGRVTSDIWNHFVKTDKRGECSYCKASLSIPSGSTTNLKRHMKTKHPLIPFQREEKPRSRSPSVDAVPVQVQKVGRFTSDIWNHFVKTDKRGECSYCKVSLSIPSGSTANLKRHMKTKHPLIPLRREEKPRPRSPSVEDPGEGTSLQQILSQTSTPIPSPRSSPASVSPFPAEGSSTDDTTMSPPPSRAMTPRSTQSSMSGFDDVTRPISIAKERSLDIQLLKMVCKEYHPFSLVEDEEFKKFVIMLNPGYELPSRKTLGDSLLPSVLNDILDKVKVAVDAAQALCVTCECWTNIQNVSYYALTAHFLDGQTRMQSCLLECSKFPKRYISANVSTWISEVLDKFCIRNKVCTVVTNNAASIKAAVTTLNLRHVSCYAHTFNLVVKDAIVGSINDVVTKAKGLVQYFKKTSLALAKLNEMQATLQKDQLNLKEDVPTRWNSTYDMLERIVRNKEPIVSALALLGNTDVNSFTQQEWDIMTHAVELLRVFNAVTRDISAESTVSLSKTTVLSRIMARTVKAHVDSNPDVPESISMLRNLLYDGLSTRFGHRESNEFISQTVILDPRFKSQGFGDQQNYKAAYRSLIGMVKLAAENSGTTPSLEPAPQDSTSSSSIWEEFDAAVSHLQARQDPTSAATVEVDKYLNEPYLPRTSDPLQWWETRKLTYPNVYAVVLKRLCVPATSVPCERLFSKAGQISIEKRNRLLSDKICEIVFVNNNLHLM